MENNIIGLWRRGNASRFDRDIFVGSNPTSLVMGIFYPVSPQNADIFSVSAVYKLHKFL